MSTATRRERASLPGSVGRHPWAWAATVGGVVAAGAMTWWCTQLWGLPDIAAPFDVAAVRDASIPDERNAFFEYRDASAALDAIQRANRLRPDWPKYGGEWSKVDPAWRKLLALAGPALVTWRAGSERPDYLYPHPGGPGMKTILPVSQGLGVLGRLAILEGSRRGEAGEMAEAWGWYRAAFRSSRHNGRHGFQIERLMGAALHKFTADALTRWASDPRVDAPLLRRALAEVIAADALTWPESGLVRTNYLMLVESMRDPDLVEEVLVANMYGDETDWSQRLPVPKAAQGPLQRVRVLAADDRERSLRVIKLVTANWLAEVDKPPARRAPLVRADPPIYDVPGALDARALGAWLDSSLLGGRFLRAHAKATPNIERERPRQARLVVHLADQLYRREHGRPPASPADLVGPDLKELPEGHDAPP